MGEGLEFEDASLNSLGGVLIRKICPIGDRVPDALPSERWYNATQECMSTEQVSVCSSVGLSPHSGRLSWPDVIENYDSSRSSLSSKRLGTPGFHAGTRAQIPETGISLSFIFFLGGVDYLKSWISWRHEKWTVLSGWKSSQRGDH